MGQLKRRGIHFVRGGLLLLLFALLVSGARQVALTADEPAHLASGYAYLARGWDGLWAATERNDPAPAMEAFSALPLFIVQPDIPLENLPGWKADFTSYFQAFKGWLEPLERTRMAVRIPVILLTVLLAAGVCRWATDLWGERSGLLALGILIFDPALLAHGRLATTDAGVVAFGTLALYLTWRWTKQPSWQRALGLGFLLALTVLSKGSGFLVMAAAALMVLVAIIERRREGRTAWLLAQAVGGGGFGLFLLWAGYGFSWGQVGAWPFALPVYWSALFRLNSSANERWIYALGQYKYGRWWWYFPVAFLIKNPLPLLIGLAISLMVFLRRLSSWSHVLVLGLFPLLYTGIAILEGINIGYRHMLPVHPFLYLMIASGLGEWDWQQTSQPWQRWLLGILGVWYALSVLRVFPYEISYFNELVGGPSEGYRYLSDSNVDWGQCSDVQTEYIQAHPGTRADPPDCKFRPLPGRYIVSASYLHGSGISDPYAYAWFRHWNPQTVLNYSLLVYDVPPFDLRWVAQCTASRIPLDEASIVEGTGHDDLRHIGFDCTKAWLFPAEGAGIYVLDGALVKKQGLCLPSFLACPPAPDDPFIAHHLAHARLSFEGPDYLLYEMTAMPEVPSLPSPVYAVSAELPLATLETATKLSAPISFDGPLTFLSVTSSLRGDVLEVETWWQVTHGSVARPYSIMAHLLSTDGEIMDIADGLGAWQWSLATGDVLVERHRFGGVSERTEVWLRTGAYWLDTMERWTVTGMSRVDALLIRLRTR